MLPDPRRISGGGCSFFIGRDHILTRTPGRVKRAAGGRQKEQKGTTENCSCGLPLVFLPQKRPEFRGFLPFCPCFSLRAFLVLFPSVRGSLFLSVRGLFPFVRGFGANIRGLFRRLCQIDFFARRELYVNAELCPFIGRVFPEALNYSLGRFAL